MDSGQLLDELIEETAALDERASKIQGERELLVNLKP